MITTNSSTIRVKLVSAITTSQMAITGHYVTMDVNGIVSNVVQINMLTNGTSSVDVVPSSSSLGLVNVLKNLQIANVDTLANQVIIEQWDGMTAKSMCPGIPLDVTQAIQVNADGDLTIIPVAGGGSGAGTVTSVHGTGTISGITLTGTVTTSGNLTLGGTLAVTPSNFASQTANTFLAAPNGAAGVPTFRNIVAADVPTLNQNTTGNAATATLASTVTTNANLTGDVISTGNATTYAGTVPVSKGGTGVTSCTVLGQFVSTENGTMATGTTTVPMDNTIPQNTEGTEFFSLAITPKSATSKLKIEVVFYCANSVAANNIIAALFQDSTANSLASSVVTAPGANYICNIKFTHIMTSGTTSATTFKVRAGGNAAGTTTFNGSAGASYMGGTFASSISITEFLP